MTNFDIVDALGIFEKNKDAITILLNRLNADQVKHLELMTLFEQIYCDISDVVLRDLLITLLFSK